MSELYKSVEQRILDAIEAIRKNDYNDCTNAAKAFDVSVRTLQRRWNGAPSKSTRSPINRALTDAQEQAIFVYIERLDRINMSARPKMIVGAAN